MENLSMREKLLNELAEFFEQLPDAPEKKPALEGGVDGDEAMPGKGVKVGMLEVEGKPGMGQPEGMEDESGEGDAAAGEMVKKLLGKA